MFFLAFFLGIIPAVMMLGGLGTRSLSEDCSSEGSLTCAARFTPRGQTKMKADLPFCCCCCYDPIRLGLNKMQLYI